jgi:hypothetical protein
VVDDAASIRHAPLPPISPTLEALIRWRVYHVDTPEYTHMTTLLLSTYIYCLHVLYSC